MGFLPLTSPWWWRGDLEEVTPNTSAGIGIEELKDYLKISTIDDDAELTRAALEVTRMIQFETGRAITSWSLKLHLDSFPRIIELPYPPLLNGASSITGFTYVDANGASQTLAASDYQLHHTRDFIRLIPAYGTSWPATRTQFGAVQIAYTVGYVAAAVPPEVKQAIKWAVHLAREPQLSGIVGAELRKGYERIIANLRRAA